MATNLKDLKMRVISALIIAPVVLLAVYTGGISYNLTVAAFSLVALWEWLRLADPKAEGDVVFLSYAALLMIIGVGLWQSSIFAVLFGTALGTALYFVAIPNYKERTRWIVLGLPYTAGFALAIIYLRANPTPEIGRQLVAYLLAVVWGTDIGAYIFGRLIGGPKLLPVVSPNKTWAGFFGGIVLASGCAYGVAWAFGARDALVGLFLAIVLAAFSQAGDLFESWMKRRAGVKESSNLIPGHGGVLDRIDGLVFATIVFALFQTIAGVRMEWW